jgi:hypothetical protein
MKEGQMEPCEVCGATDGVQVFGIDYTPLCPKHYQQAERNVAAAEATAEYRRLLSQGYSDRRSAGDGF